MDLFTIYIFIFVFLGGAQRFPLFLIWLGIGIAFIIVWLVRARSPAQRIALDQKQRLMGFDRFGIKMFAAVLANFSLFNVMLILFGPTVYWLLLPVLLAAAIIWGVIRLSKDARRRREEAQAQSAVPHTSGSDEKAAT